jgi:hypothetical protein
MFTTKGEPKRPARHLQERGRRYLLELQDAERRRKDRTDRADGTERCYEYCTCWEWATPEYANADPDLGRRGYGPLSVRVPLMGGARITGSYEEGAA